MIVRKLALVWLLLGASTAAFAGDMQPYTGKDAAEAVGRILIREGAGDELRVQINGIREQDVIVPSASAAVSGEVEGLSLDKARNRWDATLLLTEGAHNLAPVKISGRYEEMLHVPVLKQRLQAGEIISEEDIVWEDMPAPRMRKSVIVDSKTLVGKTPKRMISAGRPIRLEEIAGPTVVAKGSQVTLVFKSPALEIKTLGEAMENGSVGSVVRVRNVASKSVLQGVVEAEGRVRIGSPENLSAGLM